MQVITLSATRPGAGKDYFASAIVKELEPAVVRTGALADHLRFMAEMLFRDGIMEPGEFLSLCNDRVQKDKKTGLLGLPSLKPGGYLDFLVEEKDISLWEHISPRQHLQWFGEDYVKGHMGLKDFWIDCMDSKLKLAAAQGVDLFIITDVRTPQELNHYRMRHDALSIRINPVGFPPRLDNNHPVERKLDTTPMDIELMNHWGFREFALANLTGHHRFVEYVRSPHRLISANHRNHASWCDFERWDGPCNCSAK